jgi:hypothetical protein
MNRFIFYISTFVFVSMAYSKASLSAEYKTYEPYKAYAPALQICRDQPSNSQCHGTESYCQNYTTHSSCQGTLAHCENYSSHSSCQGTYAHCMNYTSHSSCQGTKVYCEAYTRHNSCTGTPAFCRSYPTHISCRTLPYDPCRDSYYSQECLNHRCQSVYSVECRDIHCRYHPEDRRCQSDGGGGVDPNVDQYCRSHGYFPWRSLIENLEN